MCDIKRCRNGHEISGQNIYLNPRGVRECRACRTIAKGRAKQRAKQKPLDMSRMPAQCRHGHILTPQLVHYREGLFKCRICARESGRKYREKQVAAGRYAAKGCVGELRSGEFQRIVSALAEGKTLKAIMAPGPARIISPDRMRAFQLAHPADYTPIRMLAISNRSRFSSVTQHSKTITRTNSWMDQVAVPAIQKVCVNIPFFMRDDIRQDLMMMVWSGEVAVADIPATAKRLLSRQYSGYDLSSKWGHRSLDAPMFDDSSRTLAETVTRGLW